MFLDIYQPCHDEWVEYIIININGVSVLIQNILDPMMNLCNKLLMIAILMLWRQTFLLRNGMS